MLDDRSGLWRAVGRELGSAMGDEEGASTVDAVLEALGPTPSARRMIPEILHSIPKTDAWDGRVAATGARKSAPRRSRTRS